jgi:DNA-directed RNA polymerase specialized sigma24 family protein
LEAKTLEDSEIFDKIETYVFNPTENDPRTKFERTIELLAYIQRQCTTLSYRHGNKWEDLAKELKVIIGAV